MADGASRARTKRRVRIPVERAIKKAIRGYPLDVGLVKELLQNADDAGASELHLTVDWREHPLGADVDPRWGPLMGPALLAYNDRPFTDEDLDGIVEYAQGSKSRSPSKTGRFGLGFSSVYNLTDHPCFVTRDELICLDPQESLPGIWEEDPLLEDLWADAPDVLRPFVVGGLADCAPFHDAVTFRLPFRRAESAHESRISRNVFAPEHLDKIVEQVREAASELMLFLRSVSALRISSIASDGDTPELLFEISGGERETVSGAGSDVHAELEGDLETLLDKWVEADGFLPNGAWTQSFEVRSDGRVTREEWLVVAGLFDEDRRPLAKHARQMLEEEEKAVPWAGAAARIERVDGRIRGVPVTGRWYCSLPLPELTGLPVHVNGFLDVDSNRRGPTDNRTAVTDQDRVRGEWNEKLIEVAIVKAYGRLLQLLKTSVDDDGFWFYELWPKNDRSASRLARTLVDQFYVYARAPKLIRVRARPRDLLPGLSDEQLETGWICPMVLRITDGTIADELRSALVLLGFDQPVPWPPPFVVDGLRSQQSIASPLIASEIASCLTRSTDVDCEISQAPLAACRTRGRVEALAHFFVSSDSKLLAQLPLAVVGNGRLHTFATSVNTNGCVYIAEPERRELFEGWWDTLCLAPDFVEATDLEAEAPVDRAKILPLDVGTILRALKTRLDPSNSPLLKTEGEDSGTGPILSAEWLERLCRVVATAGEDDKVRAALGELAVIPDESGRLHPGFSAVTPLRFGRHGPPHGLEWACRQLGMDLLGGPPSLQEALAAIDRLFPGFCPTLSPQALVEALSLKSHDWANRRAAQNPRTFVAVSGYLAASNAQQSFGRAILEQLKGLPFLPASDGSIVSADTTNLFSASGFEPPRIKTRVLVVEKVSVPGWAELLKALDLTKLTRARFVIRVLRDAATSLEPTERVTVLRWVYGNRSDLLKEGTQLERARKVLGDLPLVPCADGQFRAPTEVNDPSDDDLRVVLGTAFCPADYGTLGGPPEEWTRLLRKLGMSSRASSTQILRCVDELTQRAAQTGVAAVRDDLERLLSWLEEHWSEVRNGQPRGGRGESLMTCLRRRRWLPVALRAEDLLADVAGFIEPPDELYPASEVVMPAHARLACSQLPVLGFTATSLGFLRDLGLPEEVPFDLCSTHFRHCLDLWHGLAPAVRSRDLAAFARTAEDFYRRANAAVTSGLADLDAETFGAIPSVWLEEGKRFFLPKRVFAGGVTGFEPRWVARPLGAALRAMGCREEPDGEALIELLDAMEVEFSGEPLDEDASAQARHLMFLLDRYQDLLSPGVPVLTTDLRLLQAKGVWRNDASWLGTLVQTRAVPVIHKEVPPGVSRACKVRRITEVLREELDGDIKQATGDGVRAQIERLERRLRSAEFRGGLIRIAASQGIDSEQLSLGWLGRLQLLAVEHLTVRAVLGTDNPVILGQLPSSHYLDRGRGTLLIEQDVLDAPAFELAKAVHEQLALPEQQMLDLAPVEAILRLDPERMWAELDRRRIPAIGLDDVAAESSPAIDARFLEPDDEDAGAEASEFGFLGDSGDSGSFGFSAGASAASDRWGGRFGSQDSTGPPVHAGHGVASGLSGRDGEYIEDDWEDESPPGHWHSDNSTFPPVGGGATPALTSRGGGGHPPSSNGLQRHMDALAAVVDFEELMGRSPTDLGHGADLDFESGDRLIKVVVGTPSTGYGSLPLESLFALEEADEAGWLYFVEIGGLRGARIRTLRNPARQIGRLRLPRGWGPARFDEEWPDVSEVFSSRSGRIEDQIAVGVVLIRPDGSEVEVVELITDEAMPMAVVEDADGEREEILIHENLRIK